jgi:hypothetical protein
LLLEQVATVIVVKVSFLGLLHLQLQCAVAVVVLARLAAVAVAHLYNAVIQVVLELLNQGLVITAEML